MLRWQLALVNSDLEIPIVIDSKAQVIYQGKPVSETECITPLEISRAAAYRTHNHPKGGYAEVKLNQEPDGSVKIGSIDVSGINIPPLSPSDLQGAFFASQREERAVSQETRRVYSFTLPKDISYNERCRGYYIAENVVPAQVNREASFKIQQNISNDILPSVSCQSGLTLQEKEALVSRRLTQNTIQAYEKTYNEAWGKLAEDIGGQYRVIDLDSGKVLEHYP